MILYVRPLSISASILSVAVGSLAAQDISVGGRVGLVGAAVLFEDPEAADYMKPKPGFQIGGAVAYGAGSVLSVRAELWYVQKVFTETQAGAGRRLSYLELPMFLTVTAPWTTAPQLVTGVSASRELGCSVTGVPAAGTVSCDDPLVEWRHSATQFAGWFGVGIQRRLGPNRLHVQLLGSVHLTNLNSETLPRGYSRLVSAVLSVSYMVALGGRVR